MDFPGGGFYEAESLATKLPWNGCLKLFTLALVQAYLVKRLIAVGDNFSALLINAVGLPHKGRIPEAQMKSLAEPLGALKSELNSLDLKMTFLSAERLLSTLNGMDKRSACAAVREMRERFDDEISSVMFMHLKGEKLKFYEQEALFGDAVAKAFPSAAYDIKEAGNCFAFDRYTATVAHCMRVLEVGLKVLAKALRVETGESSWNRSLSRLQSKWTEIESASTADKPKNWLSLRQFYSEAFTDFRQFKDAWRNHAMHARSVYDEAKSKVILDHVQSFMRHLAIRLHERKPRR